MQLTLFQRDDCPLCDRAYEVLLAAGVADFEPRWIDGDARLEAGYGSRVPVLRRERDGVELNWPFSRDQVLSLLDSL